MKPVIIFGNSKFAELAYFYLISDSDFRVAGFTVDESFLHKDSYKNLPIISFQKIEEKFPPSHYDMFIPLGYREVNFLREKKYKESKLKGYNLISYISSKSVVETNMIGENCFIGENNIIQPYSKIGNNCIIRSACFIGHHSVIDNNCFIASHAVIGGSVKIGSGSFVGLNATIKENISIGKKNIVGACSLIKNNSDDFAVFGARATKQSKVPSYQLKKII